MKSSACVYEPYIKDDYLIVSEYAYMIHTGDIEVVRACYEDKSGWGVEIYSKATKASVKFPCNDEAESRYLWGHIVYCLSNTVDDSTELTDMDEVTVEELSNVVEEVEEVRDVDQVMADFEVRLKEILSEPIR